MVGGFGALGDCRAGAVLAGLTAELNGASETVWRPLYLACHLTGGWGSAWAGVLALRNKALDVDLLIIVAIGQIFDGALLIVIFATSGALDDVATKHTADSVKGLLDLAPDRAVVVDGGHRPGAERRDSARGTSRRLGALRQM